VVDEATAAVERAVASLAAVQGDAPLALRVNPGWWTPAGPPVAGKAAGAEPALWICGEIETRLPGGGDWSQGGQADIAILLGKGEVVASYSVPLAAGNRSFSSRFPRSEDDVWLDQGTYAVRVRVTPAKGGLPTTDTRRVELPTPPGPDSLLLGLPLYTRRGHTTGSVETATADLRFRRTDRMAVECSATVTPGAVTGELLDRTGKVLALPVTATTYEQDAVTWVRGEVALASLAPGDYVLRLSATRGNIRRQALAPFRIIP
jgi:hypothetical protein